MKMKMKKFTIFVVLLAFHASCAHQDKLEFPQAATKGEDYSLSWQYSQSTRIITITLRNLTENALCYDPSFWPDQNGDMHYAGEFLSIEIGGNEYWIEDQNLGYGQDGYGPYLPGGGENKAEIPLSNFGIDSELEIEKITRLNYSNFVGHCK